MTLSFPPEADTPLKKYQFLTRVKAKLIAWHNTQRAKLPPTLTPKKEAAWMAWLNTEFRPRQRKLFNILSPIQKALAAKIVAADDAEFMEKLGDMKDAAGGVTSWDSSIGDVTDI